jgi:hypothetical protein
VSKHWRVDVVAVLAFLLLAVPAAVMKLRTRCGVPNDVLQDVGECRIEGMWGEKPVTDPAELRRLIIDPLGSARRYQPEGGFHGFREASLTLVKRDGSAEQIIVYATGPNGLIWCRGALYEADLSAAEEFLGL